MGSFFGHALPGAFFIVFASWWCVQIYRRFYQSLQTPRGSDAFTSSVTWPVRTRKGWLDVEAYAVVVAVTLGMLVELVAATLRNGHLGVNNTQHATMYFFFGLTSLCAIVAPKVKVIAEPDSLTYICLFMAYTAEGLLFKFHLFGRSHIDQQLHTLLVYTIFASSVVTLAECKYRHNVLLPLARSFLTILQGTWFYQAAFVLYPPLSAPWHGSEYTHEPAGEGGAMDHNVHNMMMLITCAYTWHAAVIFIVMLLTGVAIGKYYDKHGGLDQGSLQRSVRGNPSAHGYDVVSAETEDL